MYDSHHKASYFILERSRNLRDLRSKQSVVQHLKRRQSIKWASSTALWEMQPEGVLHAYKAKHDRKAALQKESGLDSYNAWYPPVRETLTCLSKLYRCVEPRVFAGLAQDAVTACTSAVQVKYPFPPCNSNSRRNCNYKGCLCIIAA